MVTFSTVPTPVSDDNIDGKTMIWRYMSFAKFVSMLDSHSLFFARPFKFDDKWEGLFPPSYRRNSKQYMDADFEEEFRKRKLRHRYGHFVNCWHTGAHESDAMWRLYGLSPEGVAIQSTIGNLRECINPDNSGLVRYYDPVEDIRSATIFGPSDILFKRKPFSYENEFRVWFDDDEVLDKIERGDDIDENDLSPGELKGVGDLQMLVKKVVVAPGASKSVIDLIKGVCGAYNKAWLANRVERSYSDLSWESFSE